MDVTQSPQYAKECLAFSAKLRGLLDPGSDLAVVVLWLCLEELGGLVMCNADEWQGRKASECIELLRM